MRQAQLAIIIIVGTWCDEALIRVAFDFAAALDKADMRTGISYVLPECNSMGMAMMRAPSLEAAIKRVEKERNITAVILENDLYRRIPAAKADAFFSHCKNVIVLDSLHNHTTEKAHVLIPAASFAEADGTLVNNEGRAQRFFQVFMPADAAIKESWKWLWQMKALQAEAGHGQVRHPADLRSALEKQFPQFAGISGGAPPHDFRLHGEAIPREPHRYSC